MDTTFLEERTGTQLSNGVIKNPKGVLRMVQFIQNVLGERLITREVKKLIFRLIPPNSRLLQFETSTSLTIERAW